MLQEKEKVRPRPRGEADLLPAGCLSGHSALPTGSGPWEPFFPPQSCLCSLSSWRCFSWSRTSHFSLSPQSKRSGPFPGKVLLTDAARNGRGITVVGTDPRTPPKLLGQCPGVLTHPFPWFVLSIGSKSLDDAYSGLVLSLGLPVSPSLELTIPRLPARRRCDPFRQEGGVLGRGEGPALGAHFPSLNLPVFEVPGVPRESFLFSAAPFARVSSQPPPLPPSGLWLSFSCRWFSVQTSFHYHTLPLLLFKAQSFLIWPPPSFNLILVQIIKYTVNLCQVRDQFALIESSFEEIGIFPSVCNSEQVTYHCCLVEAK